MSALRPARVRMSGQSWLIEAEACPLPDFPCCQSGVWVSARGPEALKRC